MENVYYKEKACIVGEYFYYLIYINIYMYIYNIYMHIVFVNTLTIDTFTVVFVKLFENCIVIS